MYTNTLGVLLILGGLVAEAPNFAGPVDVALGKNDLVFCGGDCNYPEKQAAFAQRPSIPNPTRKPAPHCEGGWPCHCDA
ncbi:hypothetical protein EYZ11_011686 [Aspergillus tanneri]|uniref:Uncharacterized protein n=1 Tax=Aspergillus tanneri TaxID=1220188 RepID=A0A4S3J4A6_9EURO|nr:hypothetical protein EYZ11_011686 [Aspergillus tanneri]